MPLKSVVDNLDDIDEALKAFYVEGKDKKFVLQVEGMKPEVEFNVVHTALAKERADHKIAKTKMLAFGDLDPVDVKEKLALIPTLEAAVAGKDDPAKLEALVETRLQAKLTPLNREKTELQTKNAALETENALYKGREVSRTLNKQLQDAAKALKVRDTAIEDISIIGAHLFELDSTGKAIAKEGGSLPAGTDPTMWLKDSQATKPHWWEPSKGGGSGGSGGSGGGANPWALKSWNMTEQSVIIRADRAKADRMAKQAGTVVGGGPPKE